MNREDFVKAFQSKLAIRFSDGYQSWWHKFIFHFSDISNSVSILNSGKLYSRNKAVALGVMKNDNASDEVIGNTDLNAKDFVRFYFGTGTPTQFHNALDIYDGLLYLCVRSQAEKETLVHFLSPERREYLSDKILIRSNGLFEPYRFYVERVSLVNQQIKIVFSMPTRDKYLFKTTVINHDTGAKENEIQVVSHWNLKMCLYG